MLDNTKTETYFREPDWNGIRDELIYLTELGHRGWWGECDLGASICQENVLRYFGSSAYRLLHGLTKGEDYGCLEMMLADFSCWLQHTGDVCYGDEPVGELMWEIEADTDDVVRFLGERRTADLPWPDDLREAGRAATMRMMGCRPDNYPDPNFNVIMHLLSLEDEEMGGIAPGAGGFASAYTTAILPMIGAAAMGLGGRSASWCTDDTVLDRVAWMLELIDRAGGVPELADDFALRRRLRSLERGIREILSCLRHKDRAEAVAAE